MILFKTVCAKLCRDGSSKIFQLPLPSNKLAANQMRGVDIKSVLASTSAESAEVAALEDEMATELAREAGGRGKGNAEGSPELDEGPSITPTPSKRAEIDRYAYALHLPSPSDATKPLKIHRPLVSIEYIW